MAAAGAVWLLVNDEGLIAPAEHPGAGWAALALAAGTAGTALLLLPEVAAAHWPWRMRTAHIPAPLKGLGITFITTGLVAMAFMTFSGI